LFSLLKMLHSEPELDCLFSAESMRFGADLPAAVEVDAD
jgi:hypothetical protein